MRISAAPARGGQAAPARVRKPRVNIDFARAAGENRRWRSAPGGYIIA